MVKLIEGSEFRKHNGKQNVWWCVAECSCGKRFEARLRDVVRTDSRRVKSCGCAFKVGHITSSECGKVRRIGVPYHKHNGRQNVTYCVAECGYCGKQWEVQALGLLRLKSCGCQNLRSAKHGQTDSRAYKTWISMRSRCLKESDPNYFRYGGRGITVCDEWRDDFQAFWAYMGDPPKGMSIDRIDNEKGYEPGNVRWATNKQQMRNRRCNRWLVVDGVKMTLSQAAEELGHVNASSISKRIEKYGMSHEEAVRLPSMRKAHVLTIYGKSMPLKDWCKISGVRYATAHRRLESGWTHKEAVFGREKA